MENQMLCYQCCRAKDGKYCNDVMGACGKAADSSFLQDELTGALIGLARACIHKSVKEEVQLLIVQGLCATSANSSYDDAYIMSLTEQIREAKGHYIPKFGDHNTSIKLPQDFDIRNIWQKSPDIRSLKSLVLFGLRGLAQYVSEGMSLGYQNKEALSFFHKALISLGANHFKEDYYDLLKEMGGISLRAMTQTSKARVTRYGSPVAVKVPRIVEPGPFIVVSGNRLDILEEILEQTNGTGINVYSHGEMLMAHGYPVFRKYRHFIGHYGTAWQNQQQEFDNIPAAIIFTSGCMMLPLNSYADRIFTAGNARIGGIPHLDGDYSDAIGVSVQMGGAPQQVQFPGVNGGTTIETGLGAMNIRTLSYKLAAALKEGNLHHIYVIGGCDGPESQRSLYTDMARNLSDDCVVITWGCVKYRFNDISFQELAGVPRLIDMGSTCEIGTVVELIEAIAGSAKLRVEELPLTWHITWAEQRSVAQIFAMLATDIRHVVLGPSLPPFFTQSVFAEITKENNMTLLNQPIETKVSEVASAVIDEEELPFVIEDDEIPEDIPPEEIPEDSVTNAPLYDPDDVDSVLPDWAVMDEDDNEENKDEDLTSDGDILVRDGVATINFSEPDSDEPEEYADKNELSSSPFPVEAPKIVIPKGKGVSGYHDDNQESGRYFPKPSPVHELVEIPPAPAITLPEGAGITGFAADKSEPAYTETANEALYSFAEPLPEIKIPKGKGVSGWKEEDDQFVPKKTSDEGASTEKPWLKKSLERLHAQVEEDQKAPEPIPSAIEVKAAADVKESIVSDDAVAETEVVADKTENSDKPWLERSLKELKASIAADEEAENHKNDDKPWLKQSLATLHAEVEAEQGGETVTPDDEESSASTNTADEENYVSSFKHDSAAAESKPWLKQSLDDLHQSIDDEAGIKTIREESKPSSVNHKQSSEVKQWDNIPTAPKWGQIGFDGNTDTNTYVPQSVGNTQGQSTEILTDEPSGGGEAPEQWQKPPVLEKPWDKDLQPIWHKPEVTVKPWQNQTQDAAEFSGEVVEGNGNTGAEQNVQYQYQQQLPQSAAMQQAEVYSMAQQNFAAQQQIDAQAAQLMEQQAQQTAQYQYQQQQLAEAFATQQAEAYAIQQQNMVAQQQIDAQAAQLMEQQEQQAAQYQYQQQQLAEAVAAQQAEAYAIQQQNIATQQQIENQTRQIRQARQEQESYGLQLREQAAYLEEMRIRQEAESIRLQNQAADLHRAQQEQQSRLDTQSYHNRKAQAEYAAQINKQAEELQNLRRQLESAKIQIEQEAIQVQQAREAQQEHARYLAEEEQRLAARQTEMVNPYQIGNMPQQGPIEMSGGAGTSGYSETGFRYGAAAQQGTIADTVRQYPTAGSPVSTVTPQGGTSGSRYYEAPPTVQTDYSQLCYGVPQRTPVVNYPQGVGVSGWNQPQMANTSIPVQNMDFFGFMNSDAPAGARNQEEVIARDSGDEYIATTGPDGEVTMTIKQK